MTCSYLRLVLQGWGEGSDLEQANGVLVQGADELGAAGVQALGERQRSGYDAAAAPPQEIQLSLQLARLAANHQHTTSHMISTIHTVRTAQRS